MSNKITPLKVILKRHKRSLKSKLKRKKKRILSLKFLINLKKELGDDISLNNQFEIWLPESIKYILEKINPENLDYKNYSIHNNIFKIFVPNKLCLISNAKESYGFIYNLLYSILSDKFKKIIIDYSKCEKIELNGQIYLDIILKDSIQFIKRRNRYKKLRQNLSEIEAININNIDIKKILFSIGSPAILKKKTIYFEDIVPYNLCTHNKSGNRIDDMQRKEIDTTQLVDHVITSLKTVNKTLNSENKEDLSTVIGEVLINAEEHSTMNNRYSTGYFQKINNENNIFGIYHLVIMNFGKTIYEKFLSDDCKNYDIKEKMKNLSQKYTKNKWFSTSFEEETLWTLYALQEGVTSVSTERYKRGNGSIRFIESFFNLRNNPITKDEISTMGIISGNTNIIFDGTYKIEEKIIGNDRFKVMTFNSSGNIEDKPDKNFVKFAKNNYFPGTIFYANILITQDDTTNYGQ